MSKQTTVTTTEAALVLGVSRQRVLQYIAEGRIAGAVQVYDGGPWLIPCDDTGRPIIVPSGRPLGRPKSAPARAGR